MNILLGVTGGIAAYKACDIISGLKATGHTVKVVATESALAFTSEHALAVLSESRVLKDEVFWDRDGGVAHIEITKWADVFVVAPATANIIAKFAHGLADDVLSTVNLAVPPGTPKFLFPAMNTVMLNNPAVQRNLQDLDELGWFVSGTADGKLACGDIGNGKLLKPREIVGIINENINN